MDERILGQPPFGSQGPLSAAHGEAVGGQYPSTGDPGIAAPAGPRAELWASIPRELRERAQWVLAGPDKEPRTPVGLANVTDRSTWTDFRTACAHAYQRRLHVGYVLTADDPFTCIDLDVKEGTTPEQMQRFVSIVQTFDSYSERSRSGRGLHIWVDGSVGPGRKRDGVEVYSQERYIICTGDVWLDRPIEQRQALLAMLIAEIDRGQATTRRELIEVPPVGSDEAVYWRARNYASSPEKFDWLWNGNWRGGYPSQSEADEALLSYLVHATPSNEQVRRLFRWSGLGRRKKAQRDAYLNYTLRRFRATEAAVAQIQAGLR